MIAIQSQARFIDVHVHLIREEGIECVLPAGVVAVRNAGMKENASRAALMRLEKPAIITSGWAIYKRGGYGTRFGSAVDTKEEIKAEIRRLKKAGADIIKIMASGMVSLKKPGTITPGGFDRDEIRLIVEDAGELGLGVMAHANGEAAVIAAAEAGVRSIEHGFFMTRRALEAIERNKVYWVPTIGALVRAAERDTGPGAEIFTRELVQSHLDMLLHAYEIGVRLAVGTDCLLPDPGYPEAYRAEISFFEKAGIPNDAVTQIACEGGARLLGLE